MVQLFEVPDKFVWKLNPSGLFTVKSMYLDLMNDDTRYLRKYLCKLKIPLKTTRIPVYCHNFYCNATFWLQ